MEVSSSPQAHRCFLILFLWVTRAYIKWSNQLHHTRVKFDQRRLGQLVQKVTTLSTDLPLHHWQELRRNHQKHQLWGTSNAQVLQVPPKPTTPAQQPRSTQTSPKRPPPEQSSGSGTTRAAKAAKAIAGLTQVPGVQPPLLGAPTTPA